EDGIRDFHVTGVQTCALPIFDIWSRGYEEFAAGGTTALIFGLGARPSMAILDNDFLYVLFRLGIVGALVHFGLIAAALFVFLREIGRASCRDRWLHVASRHDL